MTEERRVSPDGRYVWDGGQWVPNINTVSPDGRYVWDGAQWLPNAPPPDPAPADVWPMAPKLPKKEAAQLAASLSTDEKVLGQLVGAYDQVIVATDRRILILKHGMSTGTAFGSKTTSYGYHLLTSVEVRTGAVGCVLEVSAGGVVASQAKGMSNAAAPNAITFTRKQIPDVQAMASKIRERIGPAAVVPAAVEAANPLIQLQRLAELKDAGLLTKQEFAAKKTEILARP